MSDLKTRVSEARNKLIEDSRTPIGMSNARQKLRTAQEVALTLIDATLELVDQMDTIKAELDKEGET